MISIVVEKLEKDKINIQNKFTQLYRSKLKVENLLLNHLEKKDIAYNLNTKETQNIDEYTQEFMNQIWKNPKSLATILLNSKINDFKNNLAHFIIHNLYDNISSLIHKDDQLIYIITLLLKEEINNLKDLNELFIEENKIDIIFFEFSKKIELRFFFKRIFLEILNKLEDTYSFLNISLTPEGIKGTYNLLFNSNKEEYRKKFSENALNKIKSFFENDEKNDLIKEKFILTPFNEYELNKKLEEYKGNKEMKDFIENIITITKSSQEPEKFFGSYIINNLNQKELNYYINSFIQSIDIIDMIFDDLIKYSDLLPYSIRCIFKILLFLISKKFPKSRGIEQIRILSYYFFKKIFFSLIFNFQFNTFINEIEILKRTKNNILIIHELLDNIVIGDLFTGNLSPFNWYIIEKIPKIFELFNNICQVNLPSFIDKLINDGLPENYEYDYFSEHPEEKILYRNICFNNDELSCLLTNVEECKNRISINKRVLSKIGLIREIIEQNKNDLLSLDKNNNKNEIFVFIKKGINYFLLTDFINNKEYDKIISYLENKNKYFYLKEIKIIETNEDRIQNNIIKAKNLLIALLYNFEKLSKNNFKSENWGNIVNILKELKKNTSKYPFILDNNYIPINWYLDSLIQNLPRLPKNYIENDYEKFLDEIKNDLLNSSIFHLKEKKFENLEKLDEYLRELDKENLFFNKIKNIFNDIILNEEAYNFINYIEKNKINFKFKSKVPSEKALNEIFKADINFSNLFNKNKKEKGYYNTIEIFINNFPNLSNINANNLSEIRNAKVIIDNYLILIKNELYIYKYESKKNIDEIYNKIYDYIMERLYNRLFPKEQLDIDNNIYKNCKKHIWINFNNLIKKEKDFILDNYLPDSINSLRQFEIEKSPRKKLLCLKNLFKSMNGLVKFNGDKPLETDVIIPLLEFSFIKSKPEKIYSNCKYVEFFCDIKDDGKEGNFYLSNMLAVCELISNISLNNLYNITESDYEQNCKLSDEGLFY